ncbi:universal stress protein [Sphingomonas oligophenolica]|uniref:Universal stress protein n=1 Tax=Sphingomonas oligophenolica TaxID=301154 RepID=A0ABU9Y3B9_9SPHN
MEGRKATVLRDLLVHVDGSRAGRRRVRFASALAAHSGARLSGLHVTPQAEAPPVYKPSVVAAAERRISTRLARDAEAAEMIFREEVMQAMPDSLWIGTTGDVVRGVCAQARYADLVVLGQYEAQGSPERHPLPVAHAVVSRCGRPVLVVPAETMFCGLTKVAIAWDGSREAVRAVHDALPLLSLARSVDIVTVTNPAVGPDETDAERLSQHLAHHGINISEDRRQIVTVDEHSCLRDELEKGGYELLVMGGYSHPMWMEFVFGGATQSILLTSKTPIFISH